MEPKQEGMGRKTTPAPCRLVWIWNPRSSSQAAPSLEPETPWDLTGFRVLLGSSRPRVLFVSLYWTFDFLEASGRVASVSGFLSQLRASLFGNPQVTLHPSNDLPLSVPPSSFLTPFHRQNPPLSPKDPVSSELLYTFMHSTSVCGCYIDFEVNLE